MNRIFTCLLALLILTVWTVPGNAQSGGEKSVLQLRTGIVVLQSFREFLALQKAVSADGGLWLVQWAESENRAWPEGLKEVAGFRKCGVFSSDISLLYGASGASLSALAAKFPVSAVARLEAHLKADPNWLAGLSGMVSATVTFPENIALNRVQTDLTKLGAKNIQPDLIPTMLRFEIPAGNIPQVLSLPYVISAGPASGRVPLNNDERGYSGAAVLSLSPAQNPLGLALSGKNIVVGVGDNSSSLTHVDLAEKTTNFNPEIPENHGMHVSGTVASMGIIDPAARGMVPKAALISEVYELILQKTPQFRQSYGMTITNNSYASQVGQCNNVGLYDAYSEAIDQLCREVPDVLHVFAAGNDGGLQCPPFPGFGNIPGSYQPAKNNLVVGNVQKDMQVRYTSSKGPVRDGRIKPEICAFGTSVYSTFTYNTYAQNTGTSMASPAIAGAAALLTERYKQLKANQLPPAVLLKGLLTGCADDRGNPGPDYKYGFGMFNLTRSIAALADGRYESRQVSPAQPSFNIPIAIPAGLAEAKILLVWEDVAASPLAAKALVNDLDLTITDPSGNILKPLLLNPTQPDAAAQPGTDTLNNIEQVVIPNPVSGNYSIRVSGNSLSGAALNVAVVYDFVEKGIRLLQPAAGVPIAAGKPLNIFWESPESNAPFTLEYSADNGATWASIGVATDSQRAFVWTVPALNTAAARVRISRGGDVTEAAPLVINQVPVVTRSSSQCPGFFSINWTTSPNASGYEILQKKGPDMVVIDTVLGNNYTLGGLPYSQIQYLAVRPLVNGQRGYRSLAVYQRPDTAKNCGLFGANDLAISGITTPKTGRVFTQTAFTSNEQVAIEVRNNGPVAADYKLSYRFGTAARQTTSQKVIAANAIDTFLLPAQDLSAIGAYNLDVTVVNVSGTDPISPNDSFKTTLRQLPNAPLNLAAGHTSDFEGSPRITLMQDSAGLFDSSRWDYARSDSGYARLRSFVDTTVVISGNRSVSLDADRFYRSSVNLFKGTFNLTGYDVSNTEVRAEFDYMVHGEETRYPDSNAVFIRGTDADPWIPLFVFDTSLENGVRRNSGSISVTDILRSAGQQLSTSTAVLFVQKDTTVIAAADYGTGYTVDNFKLYTLGNDIALIFIDTPRYAGCGLTPDAQLTVTIANGTYNPQANIPVSYRLDGGPVFTETIAALGPKDTVQLTFPQRLQIRDYNPHKLDVWVHYTPDVYPQNDSILSFAFQNQPLVSTFPYLENFESGKGQWYSGEEASWEWGTPQSPNINKAASGTKAWKTTLSGNYRGNEKSYLYSPCFDIGPMANPKLSFSIAYDFENCGNAFCDGAWVEWSTDSKTWYKLGLSVEGFNWYDSLQHRAWTGSGQYRWRVATIGLPTWVEEPIRLRFVLQSDANDNREGIAIDDIHIYDYDGPVFNGAFAGVEKPVGANQPAVDFRKDGAILARVSASEDLGPVNIRDYGYNESVSDSFATQVLLPRSFVFQPQAAPKSPVSAAFYITEADVLKMLADTACNSCDKAPDAYRLGILTYNDSLKAAEDDSFGNNRDGIYQFRPYTTINWLPYDSGYIARTSTIQTGEVWFAAGKSSYSYKTENRTLAFTATRKTPTTATLKIDAYDDTHVSRYEIYRSVAGKTAWEKIYEATARNTSSQVTYMAEDTPPATAGDTVLYQVQWIGKENGLRFKGSIYRLPWLPESTFALYPNPAPAGRFTLQYSTPIGSSLKLQLTDISGRTLYKKEFTNTVFQTTLDLPLNLRAGIYFLSTELEGKKTVEKIVAF